ncbi:hypothetical protein V496_10475 [Pseudogymnoascus sp. VKM F-4515 (FW-2607)]|nr:hypothetical protein V496_10475 [Pseudogymnoascus sp. VKM F-4515 (FW-2607)]
MGERGSNTENPMNQYILNWRPSPLEDKLGVPKFALKAEFDSTALPSSKDLTIAIVEHIAKRKGLPSDWSELYLYYNTRVRVLNWPPNEDSGAYVSSTMVSLQKYGDARERDWPYVPARIGAAPPAAAYTRGAINQIIKTAYVPNTVDSIRAAIASGRPVDIGFSCYSNFTNDAAIYRSGQIPMPTASSYNTGGHSVTIVGYDDATRKFKFKNSWSTTFGEGGYGFLPYAYVAGYGPDLPRRKLVSDCWTIHSIEFESDQVILQGEATPEGMEPFNLGIINPSTPGSDD